MHSSPVYYRHLAGLAAYFLRLGFTAFGGPAAHIALLEEDCVRRRGWISRERFLDVLGAASLIPGPTSTELAMHIGHARAGWPGLVVAGVCFILPAALMVGVLAALYVAGEEVAGLDRVLVMVKPVVVVVVAVAVTALVRAVRWSIATGAIAVVAVALALAGVNEVLLLAGAGVVRLLASRSLPATAAAVPLGEVLLYFIKAGSMVLGSGYVLLPILRNDLVGRTGWITEAQLLDAIAVGQVTPGPVFTAATFIGYLVAGPPGAAVATVGIFAPAFLFSALSVKALDRASGSATARRFLDGVNAAAVALIGVVVVALARHAIVDVPTAGAAAAAAVLLVWLRVNAAWVIVGAVALGLIL
jgi:chromate transporter